MQKQPAPQGMSGCEAAVDPRWAAQEIAHSAGPPSCLCGSQGGNLETGVQAVDSNLASLAITPILLSLCASCFCFLINQNSRDKGCESFHFQTQAVVKVH